MSGDKIITMASEAGADVHHGSMGRTLHVLFSRAQLERFAALAATAEREACASACDAMPAPASCTGIEQSLWDVATLACAQAVRARSGNV